MTPSMWASHVDCLEHLMLLRDYLEKDKLERDGQGRTWVHWTVRRTEPLRCLTVRWPQCRQLTRVLEWITCCHVLYFFIYPFLHFYSAIRCCRISCLFKCRFDKVLVIEFALCCLIWMHCFTHENNLVQTVMFLVVLIGSYFVLSLFQFRVWQTMAFLFFLETEYEW